jgi:cell shape-determining protein MreD
MPGHRSILRVIALHLIAILFVIFNVSDIKINGLSSALPLFDLMIIFYFSVFRNNFSTWFIFLMGIWSDALMGTHLGVTALCYILLVKLFNILNVKLNIQENFQQIWKQFVVFCGAFLFLKWSLLSLLGGSVYAVNIVIIQFILSSSFYVVMHKFFDYLSIKLLDNN